MVPGELELQSVKQKTLQLVEVILTPDVTPSGMPFGVPVKNTKILLGINDAAIEENVIVPIFPIVRETDTGVRERCSIT